MKRALASIIIIAAMVMFSVIALQIHFNESQTATNSPIKHIIIIFQENHAFDNYFGTYPGAEGIPSDACIPHNISDPDGPCLKPWLNTNAVDPGSLHTWQGSFLSYDYGKMDGFLYSANGSPSSVSYYNNQTIPYYWDYAHQYVLTDHLFSSALSYSLPNHWFAISARTPSTAFDYEFNASTPYYIKNEYLNQSSRIETIGDLLNSKNISWKYYYLPVTINGFNESVKAGSAFSFWDPYFAKNSSYTSQFASHLVSKTQIYSDLKNGSLPSVSWVVPPYNLSEHPPANITIGMWYVTNIVDSVMKSKYWNSTVIIIMWDDFGGYYDNVPPPQVDQFGLSFRVPGIIISPYAKQGYVDHTNYSFGSTLKFIEWNFNLPSLATRDGNANNMLNVFDFNQRPRLPYIIPLNQTQLDSVNKILYNDTTFFLDGNTTIYINGIAVKGSYLDT